ncbi:ATP-binding protein [Aquimonas sp.]|jgi:two-component system sensor histidine kinase BaeS|uniref:ATP-binding protein n=1 Tax=Aquimonas sp. TaxID=1872588 RepID=UPI0037BFA791
MRLRLWHRWFLLTAGLVLVTMAAMLMMQAHDFQNGLLAHANALEQARLPMLSERFADEYRSVGGWQRVLLHPPRWQRLLAPADRSDPPIPRSGPPAGRPGHPNRPPGPPPGGAGFPRRISLLDADGRVLHGPQPLATAVRQPIELDGRVIGSLSLQPMPRLQQPLDLDFAAQQRGRALWIALPVLAVALLASFALTRLLLRPLGALAEASRHLAGGDYGARVSARGSDEIADLSRDFNRMADSLQASRAARDRWIADISHELRTPLTVLRGEVQALQDGVRALNASAIDSLAVETERMAQRVDDLYHLALSDSGALSYRFGSVDFTALLERCLRQRAAALQAADIALCVSPLSACRLDRADGTRLEQLIDNLLANSQRYTAAAGRIEVRLQRSEGCVELDIDDSAPGVAADELARLGQRHFRAASAHHAPEGSGLGLAICANIAAAHRGSLRFSASPLGGLQVRLNLPLEGGGG